FQNDGAPCPNLCVAGACAECVPGTPSRCNADGKMVQTCNAMGHWVDGPACPFLCSSGACAGDCAPGSKQCNVDAPETCDVGGHWVGGARCAFGCGGMGVCNASPDGGTTAESFF